MTQAGPAIPVLPVTDRAADGGPALRVAVVSDGRPTEGGPARPVIVVSDGRPTQGNEPLPVVLATGVQASRVLAGPAIPIVVVSGSLNPSPPFVLPTTLTRYPSNPIIPLGAAGTWEDVDVANPDVKWDAATNQWVMNYSGYDGAVWSTGIAYSTDLLTWTKEPTNPKLSIAGAEQTIAANGSIVKLGSTYYLYYQADKAGVTKIYGASSPNLTNGGTWTRINSSNPIINTDAAETNFTSDPAVRLMPDGITIELFYNARAGALTGTPRAIWRATSIDGVNFTKTGMIFRSVGNDAQFGEPWPLGDTGAAYDLFTDYSDPYIALNPRRIMQFRLAGGSWADLGIFLGPGVATWESVQTFDSCPVVSAGGLYVYYAGGPVAGGTQNIGAQIGVAYVQYPIPTPTPYTPDAAPGLLGWWDGIDSPVYQDSAGTTPAAVNDPVGYWGDLSGNGLHLLQAVNGNRPTRQANKLLFVSATPTWLNLTNMRAEMFFSSTRNQWTAFFVVTQDSTNANNTLMEGTFTGTALTLYCPFSGTIYFDFGNSSGTGRVSVATPGGFQNAIHLLTYRRLLDGTQTIYLDGVSLVSASRSSVFNAFAGVPLQLGSNTANSINFKGTVSAAAIYGVGLADADRLLVESYFRTKFGTP